MGNTSGKENFESSAEATNKVTLAKATLAKAILTEAALAEVTLAKELAKVALSTARDKRALSEESLSKAALATPRDKRALSEAFLPEATLAGKASLAGEAALSEAALSKAHPVQDGFVVDLDLSLNETKKAFPFAKKKLAGREERNIGGDPVIDEELIGNGRTSFNFFLEGLSLAFDAHHSVVLHPHVIFLVIFHSIVRHVLKNAEKLRHRIVSHEGKKELTLECPFSENPSDEKWQDIIQKFVQKIYENTNIDIAEACDMSMFSGSTPAVQIAVSSATMAMVQTYFAYNMYTRCGFPSIKLAGKPEEWDILIEKVTKLITDLTLPDFGDKWKSILIPTLKKISETAHGHERDIPFWKSFFKRGSVEGSGAYTYISGWVNIFFPEDYLGKWNRFCQPYEKGAEYLLYLRPDLKIQIRRNKGVPDPDNDNYGLQVEFFPSSITSVPIKWTGVGPIKHMELRAGIIGAKFSYDGSFVEFVIAWYVIEKKYN